MQVLDKRTADNRGYDIDCSLLLNPTETITSVTSITADQGTLTFGTPLVNAAPVTYSNGTIAAIGKVVQVEISGGTIPAYSHEVMCTIRALVVTNQNPAIEATVLLRLTNTVGNGVC
jgi:hypothetical protein